MNAIRLIELKLRGVKPDILPTIKAQLLVADVRRFWRLTFVFGLLIVCSPSVFAQSTKPLNPTDPIDVDKVSGTEDAQSAGPIEEEMRAKRAIRFAEKEHQENVERARQISDLGKELLTVFKRKNSLGRDDSKKLDRLEKLTKRVRSEAGGSGDQGSIDKPPPDLQTAVAILADASQSLCAKVEKTPRQVISASVIDEANVLLELISIVRNLSRLGDSTR